MTGQEALDEVKNIETHFRVLVSPTILDEIGANSDASYGTRPLHLRVMRLLEHHMNGERLLKKYLDNHCANADAEGMSTLCECKLCNETRVFLNMPVYTPQ